MPKKRREIKVLIALSGGVDSSVAAALLVTAGYDVTAAYMINYDDKEQRTKNKRMRVVGSRITGMRYEWLQN